MKKRIIGLFATAIILCLLPCIAAGVETGEYNDLYWHTWDGEGCVYISGCNSDAESLFIPSEINGLPVKGIDYFYACSHCENLKSVTIAEGNEVVAEGVFGYCPLLKTVNLPSSLTKIGGGAFEFCESLENITIPPKISSLPSAAFYGCENLSISIDPQNPYLSQKDNVIFADELKTLCFYNASKKDKNYYVPDGVTTIASEAFRQNHYIENCFLPAGVEAIGADAFTGCTAIKSITIPKTVKTIQSSGRGKGIGGDALTDIYYEGSEDEWNNTIILWYDEYGLNKTPLSELPDYVVLIPDNVTVHFAESMSEPCFEVLNGDVTNTSDSEAKAVVIIANYNNQNALQTVSSQEVAFAAGETRKFNVSGNYKIFVWDSLSGMRPLVK